MFYLLIVKCKNFIYQDKYKNNWMHIFYLKKKKIENFMRLPTTCQFIKHLTEKKFSEARKTSVIKVKIS